MLQQVAFSVNDSGMMIITHGPAGVGDKDVEHIATSTCLKCNTRNQRFFHGIM